MPHQAAAAAAPPHRRRLISTAAASVLLLLLTLLASFLELDLDPLSLTAPPLAFPPDSSFPLITEEPSGPPSPDTDQPASLPLRARTELDQSESAPRPAPPALEAGAVSQAAPPLQAENVSAPTPPRDAAGLPKSPLPKLDSAVAPWARANVCPVPVGEACKCLPLRRRVQSFFRNVVLVIACKTPKPSSASAFLLQVYSPLFPHIVLVAQQPNPAVAPGSHTFLKGQPWATSYLHLPRVLRDFPSAEGVLWVSDGVALNYWQLLSANRSKLWLAGHKEASWLLPFPPKPGSLPHWKAVEALSPKLGRQFAQSCGRPRTFPRRTAEVWYIPQRHFAAAAAEVMPVLSRHRVPVDLAVPILFFALEHPQQYDRILDNIIVDSVKRDFKAPLTPWKSSVSAVQPWPLQRFSFRMHLLISFSNVDCCILEVLESLVFQPH